MATNYYFAIHGNDANSGTSDLAPWRNPDTKEASLGSDVIFNFNRGDVFYLNNNITATNSGASGTPWIFRAYGAGTMPKLSRAMRVTGWTQYVGNTWQATVATMVFRVFVDDSYGLRYGDDQNSLDATDRWYWVGGTLYLYSMTDPDALVVDVLLQDDARTVLDVTGNYWRLEDVHMDGAGNQKVIKSNLGPGLGMQMNGTYVTRGAKRTHTMDIDNGNGAILENVIFDSFNGPDENVGGESAWDISKDNNDCMWIKHEGITLRNVTFRNYQHTTIHTREAACENGLWENVLFEWPSGIHYHDRAFAITVYAEMSGFVARWCVVDGAATRTQIAHSINTGDAYLYGCIFKDSVAELEGNYNSRSCAMSMANDGLKNFTFFNNVWARNYGGIYFNGHNNASTNIRFYNNIFFENSSAPAGGSGITQYVQYHLDVSATYPNGHTGSTGLENKNNAYYASNGQANVLEKSATLYPVTAPPTYIGLTWANNKNEEPTFVGVDDFRLHEASFADFGHGQGYDPGAAVNDPDGNTYETMSGWPIGAYATASTWYLLLSDSFTQTRAIQVKYFGSIDEAQFWRFEGITPENGTDTRMATAELYFFGYGPDESEREGAIIISGVEATGEAAELSQAAYVLAIPYSAEITGSAGLMDAVPTDTQFEISGAEITAAVGTLIGLESRELLDGITELRLILSGRVLTETIAPYTPSSSPAGEVTLTLKKTFTVIRNIEVSFHGIGSAFWYYEVTDLSPSSPTIKLYNASGSPVVQADTTISVTVRGF